MRISSRTPGGRPSRYPVCGSELRVEPSPKSNDALCPKCGSLLWVSPRGVARRIVCWGAGNSNIAPHFTPRSAQVLLTLFFAAVSALVWHLGWLAGCTLGLPPFESSIVGSIALLVACGRLLELTRTLSNAIEEFRCGILELDECR